MISRFRHFKRGALVAGLTAATAAATVTVGLTPASAAVTTATVTTTATIPNVVVNTPAQAASSITITETGGTVNVGDSVTLRVNNSAGDNCTITNDTIAFTAAPTVVVTPVAGGPTFSAPVLSSSPGACTTAVVKDLLTLTATASGSPATIVLSVIKYDLGSLVPAGPVSVAVAGTGTPAGTVSNANVVAPVSVSASTALTTATLAQPIGNILINEPSPGSIFGPGFLCIAVTSTNAMFTPFTAATAPTVSATNGGVAVAATPLVPGPGPVPTPATTVTFPTTASTAAATFTVTGVKLDTTTGGPVTVAVGKSVGVGATAAAACTDAAAAAPSVGKASVGTVGNTTRFAGANRFDTAGLIAQKSFACGIGTPTTPRFAVIARGDLFPDALAGSFLAGQRKAPILLTNTDSVPPETFTALKQLGINQVFLLGLQGAISDGVATTLKATQTFDCAGLPVVNPTTSAPINITVQRIGGSDRFATAKLVAENAGFNSAASLPLNGFLGTGVPTAILASGANFPDALAAAPMAYCGTTIVPVAPATNTCAGFPLLLTAPDALSGDAAGGLTEMGIKQVIIPGGTAAVSTAVETSVTAINGIKVIRLAGADRTETATKIATFETATASATVGGLGFTPKTHINLARGDDFADALSGGPHAGLEKAPILLTSNTTTLGTFTHAYLKANGTTTTTPPGISTLDVFGGTAAVSAATATEATTAIAGG